LFIIWRITKDFFLDKGTNILNKNKTYNIQRPGDIKPDPTITQKGIQCD
jgi:hypothetical protein